jgi:hypothetical protein
MSHSIAVVSLLISAGCFLVVVIDLVSGHRQQMMIMNFVYPITVLYSGPLGLIAYYTLGRRSTKKAFWQSVCVGAMHCGSGCTLGDILAEAILLPFPLVLFGRKLYGAWLVEFFLAFCFGILFQYYSIKPMKKLSAGAALKAALKADALSLFAWQLGMYGWMAVSTFVIFHRELKATDALFWFMMQIGMVCGFLTAYPVNWWLIKKKIKEVM